MATTNDPVLEEVVDLDLLGSSDSDVIVGGLGNDLLDGAEGDDDLYGGDGNDYLYGAAGGDFLYGEEGDDELDGGIGIDMLDGGLGNDILHVGNDIKFLTGGEGNDIFSFYAAGSFLVWDFDLSADKLVFESETTGINNIEDLLGSISSIENNVDGDVVINFYDVAIITLVGVHSDDLTADMVGFTSGGI